MGVEDGQGGQWTPTGEPKGAPEGPQRPNWQPQEAQMVGQRAEMVGQGAQMVGKGVQRGPQREPEDHKKGAKNHI